MNQVDFENGSIRSNVAQTALPMLVAQMLSLLYNIVDRIYIGRIPGEGTAALGGVGLCFPVIILILAFTNLFGAGGAPLCAMSLGQGNRDRAEHILNISARLLCMTALMLTAAGLVFAQPLLAAFGASDETMPYALPYMRIYLLGNIFSMLATGLNPFINAQGFSGTGMMTIFIGAAANFILDPLFIFTFDMGVPGAAVATVISQFISALFVILFLTHGKSGLKLRWSQIILSDRRTSADITGLGMASFIVQVTNSLVAVVCNHMLSIFGGDAYISVYTIVSSIRQMMDTPVGAITDGASPILSYNYGAGRYDKIRKTIRIITVWAVGYTAAVWLLVILFPQWFIHIFSSDKAMLSAAVPALHLYFFAFVFQALQYSGQVVFRSLNRKRQAIFFSLFRKVIMVVPLTLILPYMHGLGPYGVFLAEPISNFIGGTACFLTMYFYIRDKV